MSALPDVLVCVGLFFAPGLLATYLGGLRGITAWAIAPLVTVAVVAAVAVLGGWFNFRFGLWPVAVALVVMIGLCAGLSLLLRARRVERPPGDPRGYSLAVVVGAVVAGVIGIVTFIKGIPRPDAISETYDAVYHYNAIRYIEQTGKASPLSIGTLGQPSSSPRFYPDAWHMMATLLAQLTGASIPVAAMVTCLVMAVLIWPLGCLLLARHLFGASGGRAIAAVVITGMLSSLFGGFPWLMTGWGVLWPNALGMAMAPAGVAAGMSILRISDVDTFGAARKWLFGITAAWAIGVAHPNSFLSVALICGFPLLVMLGRYVYEQWNRNTLRTTLVLLGCLVVAGIGFAFGSTLAPVRHVMGSAWPLTDTLPHAFVSAFSNGTDGQPAEVPLAVFSLIGAIACFISRQRRWLFCAELALVALYVGSAAIGTPPVRLFTGLWYDDSHRFAAVFPIVGIPLATIGVLALGEWIQRVWKREGFGAAVASRPAVALAVPLAIGSLLAAGTVAQSLPANAHTLGLDYSTSGDYGMTTPAKIQFLQTVSRAVPASALVADNPFDGTALMYTFTGTRVLFPQAGPDTNDSDMAYLGLYLVDVRHNSRVCDLVRRYGVDYMVIAPDNFLGPHEKRGQPGINFSGVVYPGPDSGFRLVVNDGPLKLYKITVCQRSNAAAPQVETANAGSG